MLESKFGPSAMLEQGAVGFLRRRGGLTGWSVVAALVGLTAFYMLGASTMVLSEPDEARCALIARHMVQSGDWLAPQLLDRPYFDKPPLYFWMLAGSVKAFGESEWALRLASAIVGAATVVLTGLLAGQFFGRGAGWIAGATLAVSVAGVMGAHVIRMDLLLAMWVTAALLCWSRGCLLERRGGWYVLMYVCMAMGCLTKGPVAILLPGLIIGLYLLLSVGWRGIPGQIRRMRPVLGVLIIGVLYGSWVGYMTWRYPEYPREFFLKQNLDRMAGSGLDAAAPWYIIPGAFVGGLMPWSLLVGLASWDRRPRRGLPPAEKFLWIWGLTVLVFFTISKARMPNYVLPAFPSTFALLGGYLAGLTARHRAQLGFGLLGTLALAGAGAIGIVILEHERFDRVDMVRLAVRLAVLAALVAPTWLLWKRRLTLAVVPLIAAGGAFAIDIAYGPAREYFASRCSKELVRPLEALGSAAGGEVVVATVPRYGAVYYAPPGWRFRLVGKRQVNSLIPLLKGNERPLYAILTGGGLLPELQQDTVVGLRVSDRLTILQRLGEDALVRIDPAAKTAGANDKISQGQ